MRMRAGMLLSALADSAALPESQAAPFRVPPLCRVQEKEEERLRAEWEAQGLKLPPKLAKSELFDSNTITPGTPFMHRLAIALQYYVHVRLNSDPGWKYLEVTGGGRGLCLWGF